MSISVLAISFDAHDAAQLALFWAQSLHRTVTYSATEEFASIAADTDSRLGPLLMFHKVPEGKTVKNRVHFDLESAEVLTKVGRLTSLGAKQIRLPVQRVVLAGGAKSYGFSLGSSSDVLLCTALSKSSAEGPLVSLM